MNQDTDRIVALGLLTEIDLVTLGSSFTRAFPVYKTHRFEDLTKSIDDADREMHFNRTSPQNST